MIPFKHGYDAELDRFDAIEHFKDFESDRNGEWRRKLFDHGTASSHAVYMVEMSIKHPVMYVFWYRWWIPSMLSKTERSKVPVVIEYLRRTDRPYWAEFSLYHPVLFLPLLAFDRFAKLVAGIVKIIGRVFKG